MLAFILIAASVLGSQQASTECVDTGQTTATVETLPMRGPAGAAAVLKVSTADDHSKNSHLCNAVYQLVVTPPGGGAPVVTELLTADDDYGRSLSLRLDGFTQDGKRIVGVFTEQNKRMAAFLFDYDITNGNVQLVDLKEQFAGLVPAPCIPVLRVAGLAPSNTVVLETNGVDPCPAGGRWTIDRSTGKPQRLATGAPVTRLYEFKSGG